MESKTASIIFLLLLFLLCTVGWKDSSEILSGFLWFGVFLASILVSLCPFLVISMYVSLHSWVTFMMFWMWYMMIDFEGLRHSHMWNTCRWEEGFEEGACRTFPELTCLHLYSSLSYFHLNQLSMKGAGRCASWNYVSSWTPWWYCIWWHGCWHSFQQLAFQRW